MFAYRRKKRSHIFSIPAKAKRHKIDWQVWLYWLFALLALAGLLYLVFWSPFFKIKKWSVEGEGFTATAQAQELVNRMLQEKIWQVIPKDNLIVFSSKKIISQILADFPEAQSVKVDKDIFKGIKITIKGRQSAAIWCKSSADFIFVGFQATSTDSALSLPSSEQCFFADSEGLIFREAPAISGTFLPTFFSQSQQDFSIGERAIASSTLLFSSQLKKQLRGMDIELLGFVDGASGSQELAAITNEGWVVYFNVNRSSSVQIKSLMALLESNDIKSKRASLQYIDLRMSNKAYYK
ncbi:MAG TPA: hypothetical protein P5089_02070 [Candidatus Portnoybacteria bacterium]|nr:hypothetical protein [Candidatus Portnoybacteria bacterium]